MSPSVLPLAHAAIIPVGKIKIPIGKDESGQVVILDKRTGQLWSWYELLQSIMYLGQIFPIAGPGPFARIIQVPEEKTR